MPTGRLKWCEWRDDSWAVDLDGDGDFDIRGEPYNRDTPRIYIWLNNAGNRYKSSGNHR